jgi:hypothetical protein
MPMLTEADESSCPAQRRRTDVCKALRAGNGDAGLAVIDKILVRAVERKPTGHTVWSKGIRRRTVR